MADFGKAALTQVGDLSKSINTKIADITNGAVFYNDFRNKPNGSVGSMDSGTLFRILDNGNNASGYTINQGSLVHGAPTSSDAASYLEVGLTNKITRMGASFIFDNVSSSGQVSLCSFAKSIVSEVTDNKRPIPNAGIHVVIKPAGVDVTVFHSGGTLTTVGSYPLSLVAGTEYSVEVIRDGSTLYLKVPGRVISTPFTDTEIEAFTSNFATFELYENDITKVPARITAIWADDKIITSYKSSVNYLDLVRMENTKIKSKESKTTTTSAVTTTLTTSYQTVYQTTGKVPESKKVLVIAQVYTKVTVKGKMLLRVMINNLGQYSFIKTVREEIGDGMSTLTGILDVPGSVGADYTITLEAQQFSGTGSVVDFKDAGQPISIITIPVS
ncbi:hypothetical protein P4639_14625 [Priestia megaterium]|uniref:hypothetical protein n=1 Tax=Priestia megaterium TaxID=1404 RepID=UPI002E1A1B60|nr:hypothetical protein [Priestia megaterium]